jgi:hypothetical protein
MASAAGRATRPSRRQTARAAREPSGMTAATASSTRQPAATAMTTVPAAGGPAPAEDHCQPVASCASIATPNIRNAASAQPRVPQAGRDLLARPQLVAGQAGQGAPGQQPVADDVGGAPPAVRPLGQVCREQFGELLAVPGPPRPRVPPQQPGRAPRGRVRAGAWARAPARARGRGRVRAHAGPQLFASRPRPTSATLRWSARCARSAPAPAAVS